MDRDLMRVSCYLICRLSPSYTRVPYERRVNDQFSADLVLTTHCVETRCFMHDRFFACREEWWPLLTPLSSSLMAHFNGTRPCNAFVAFACLSAIVPMFERMGRARLAN